MLVINFKVLPFPHSMSLDCLFEGSEEMDIGAEICRGIKKEERGCGYQPRSGRLHDALSPFCPHSSIGFTAVVGARYIYTSIIVISVIIFPFQYHHVPHHQHLDHVHHHHLLLVNTSPSHRQFRKSAQMALCAFMTSTRSRIVSNSTKLSFTS